jgi:hypothetical protein
MDPIKVEPNSDDEKCVSAQHNEIYIKQECTSEELPFSSDSPANVSCNL